MTRRNPHPCAMCKHPTADTRPHGPGGLCWACAHRPRLSALTDAELEADAAARMAEANEGGTAADGFLAALGRIEGAR